MNNAYLVGDYAPVRQEHTVTELAVTASPTTGATSPPAPEETMTTVRIHRPTVRTALTDRGFVVHYLQMLAGMLLLGPLSMLVGDAAGTRCTRC